jgi:chaperonin GroES
MPTEFFEDAVTLKNLATKLDDKVLDSIAHSVIESFEQDKESRADWDRMAEKALKLAKMEWEPKDHPWPGAANIKHPMIARAIIQFTSNLLSELVRRDKVVNSVVMGQDPEGSKARRGRRVEDFMNFQLLVKNQRWQDGLERSLQLLATVGVIFRKMYFDPIKGDNISELCLHTEIYVNNDITSLEDARRITHIQKVHSNTLLEWIRGGYYSDLTDDELMLTDDHKDDDSKMHEIVEQHCFLDLDEDGYEEPYIVVVHKDLRKVLRIIPRYDLDDITYNEKEEVSSITPSVYFVDYHCIPAFDGSFYSLGFGTLLLTMNETINTGLNQLIDAGHLANTQTGFISKDMNMKSGEMKMRPGVFHKLDSFDGDIRRAVQPLIFKEPSNVLFGLMTSLDTLGKELSSTTDIMTGNQLAQNAPATTTLTLVERGMKVYNAIQKRVFRALDKEIRILFNLNSKYLDENEYILTLDDPEASINDFEDEQIDVKPVADPDMSSDSKRLAQAELLYSTYALPEVNKHEILFRYFEAAGIKGIEQLLKNPQEQEPNPEQQMAQAEMQKDQAKSQLDLQKQMLKEKEFQLKAMNAQVTQAIETMKLELNEKDLSIKELKVKLDAAGASNKVNAELAKASMQQSNVNNNTE